MSQYVVDFGHVRHHLMTTVSPEAIGPNNTIRAQLVNYLSQQKSKNHMYLKPFNDSVRNHIRSHSNETDISIGRHRIHEWTDQSNNDKM